MLMFQEPDDEINGSQLLATIEKNILLSYLKVSLESKGLNN